MKTCLLSILLAWQAVAMSSEPERPAVIADSGTAPATGAAAATEHAVEDRTERLMEQLDARPIVQVFGVVDARGVGGAMSRGDDKWTLVFQLAAWRYAGGDLRHDKLTVRKLVENAEIHAMRARVQPYQLIRIRARVAEHNVHDRPEALLIELVDANARDPQLTQQALELQKPVSRHDPLLGTLKFDPRFDAYVGNPKWRGNAVELTLMSNIDADYAAALATAHTLFAAQEKWDDRVLAVAVDKLLALKNGVWLGEDESEFSAQQFKSRMRLHDINVYPDGRFEFWFEDGDLFWGHEIKVDGSLEAGAQDASIAG
jgi:hypothetical protein